MIRLARRGILALPSSSESYQSWIHVDDAATAVVAARVAATERHLQRVAARLPDNPADLQPETDASDAVVLHLWQAVQIVTDIAFSTCVSLGCGIPHSYASAFRTLGREEIIEHALTERLAKAAGFFAS